MAKLTVDDQDYDVADGNNLLHACLSIGLDLPYFCWHPCLGSVGACRQCAVKQYADENDERGRVVMACMTPASDGARISINDKQAKDFRAGVIELLMTNHPHDCPVCEEGGECHLQDMTEMSGHTTRTYDEQKRTHNNQYLGPLINHEMNRCISCYRCVRYYKDYAGGRDLDAMGAHHHVYFGRHTDGVLESPFAGNLVEVCPTGVFTDKTFSAHYSRKWDLQTSPSVCQHCAAGCNITPGERYGTLKRITNRYNADVNGYFLCDRGRFGYGFVNSDDRVTQPLARETINHADNTNSDTAIQCSTENSLTRLTQALKDPATIAIGSPRASLESNFALQSAVGENRFYRGIAPSEDTTINTLLKFQQSSCVNSASQRTIESCDAVLILGEDLTHTSPRTALSLRQTVRQRARELADEARIPFWQDAAVRELAQQEKSPLFIINTHKGDLDDIAENTYFNSPQKIARLGFAIAEQLRDKSGALSASLTPEEKEMCSTIVNALSQAKRPLIIAGASLLNEDVLNSALDVIKSLHINREEVIQAHLVVPEVNSIGLAMLTQSSAERSLSEALKQIESGAAKRLVVLENDLYQRVNPEKLDAALEKLDEIIVIDHVWHNGMAKADLIIPAASFAEGDGTVVSSEGRAQRFFATFPVNADNSSANDSWQWVNQALDNRWKNFDAIVNACAESNDLLAPIADLAPPADYRQHGLKVPRMSHRYSGRTALSANINVSEVKQPADPQTALGFTMEGSNVNAPGPLRNTAWAPGWNSNQSIHKFQDEVGGPLTGGSSGLCLFGSAESNELEFGVPSEQTSNADFSAIPFYHIFGSDELSNFAAPIAERSPQAYLALNPLDAAQLDLTQGDGATLRFENLQQVFSLTVVIRPELIRGLVGLPIGLGGLTRHLLEHSPLLEKNLAWQRVPSGRDQNVIATDQSIGLSEGLVP